MEERDLLSDLHISIVHNILERVPTIDAVKTCILARQWRYTWASLPSLVFDDDFETSSIESGGDGSWMNHFINQTLLLHIGPIQKFVLNVPCMHTHNFIDQWMLFLSRNDIRKLVLVQVIKSELLRVHSNLYSCQKLTHLELYGCNIPSPPSTFTAFLFLKCLDLSKVEVLSSTIESIVDNSPLLEELTIRHCSGSSQMIIHGLNLKLFRFVGGYTNALCLYAPLLVKIRIFCCENSIAENLRQNSPVCNFIKFFSSLTNIEDLSGDFSFIEYLSFGIESYQRSLVFLSLRVIKLCDVSFHRVEEMSVIAHLFMAAPNLEKLKINMSSSCSISTNASEVGGISFWDFVCSPEFTFEQLKEIEMECEWRTVDEMKFVKFLLASSPVLERMIFTDKQLLNSAHELMSYPRASTKARILFGSR